MARPNRSTAYAYFVLPLIFLKSKLELLDSKVTVTVGPLDFFNTDSI
jgi:hypothetical protein